MMRSARCPCAARTSSSLAARPCPRSSRWRASRCARAGLWPCFWLDQGARANRDWHGHAAALIKLAHSGAFKGRALVPAKAVLGVESQRRGHATVGFARCSAAQRTPWQPGIPVRELPLLWLVQKVDEGYSNELADQGCVQRTLATWCPCQKPIREYLLWCGQDADEGYTDALAKQGKKEAPKAPPMGLPAHFSMVGTAEHAIVRPVLDGPSLGLAQARTGRAGPLHVPWR